jgi:hypothetical protein
MQAPGSVPFSVWWNGLPYYIVMRTVEDMNVYNTLQLLFYISRCTPNGLNRSAIARKPMSEREKTDGIKS